MRLKSSFAAAALLAAGGFFARTINVPKQGVSPFPDTEVSTNIVLRTGRDDLRELDLDIQFAGTATNDMEVALGRDVNTKWAILTSRCSCSSVLCAMNRERRTPVNFGNRLDKILKRRANRYFVSEK